MKKETTKVEFAEDNSNLKLEYDDVSPFTGNKCVLIEADVKTGMESRICMETGYTTTDRWVAGSRVLEQYETMITQLYKDTKFTDQTLNQVWYLATMRNHLACLYADGTSKDDYVWKISYVKALDAEERLKYPVEGKEGQYHTHKVDIENAISFEKDDFKSCIDKFYETMGESL